MQNCYLSYLKTITLCLCGLVLAASTYAQPTRHSQPWLVQSKSFCFIIFHLNAADVKTYLPAGVEPQLNDQGLVTTFFEIYETEKISGLPPYKMAFIVVDIVGHNSRTGVPGHFAIWGKVDSQNTRDVMHKQFGFPYQYASEFTLQSRPQTLSSVISHQGHEILSLRIDAEQSANVTQQGAVNMLGLKPGAGLVSAEVLYLSKGRNGKLSTLTINDQHDPALGLLKKSEPKFVWIAEDQIFTYAPAFAVGK